jgi:hypothetical protein
MHLLDAWSAESFGHSLRLLGIPLAVLLATLLPGRGVARLAAIAVAACVAMLGELDASFIVRSGWVVLWLMVAGWAGSEARDGAPPAAAHRGGFESGVLALPLGLALMALLLAAVSRQSFSLLDARRATLGALVLGAGLLHLMMRRHIRRATIAFASMGLGLELLAAAARSADVTHLGTPSGAPLVAALIVAALTARIADARERFAGSPLVSEAHELRD